jgi:hypothetical protein
MPTVSAEMTIEIELQYFIDPKTGMAQYLKHWIPGDVLEQACRDWVAENNLALLDQGD